MASNIPTIKQIAWISIIPQFLIMGGLILIWGLILPGRGLLYGALNYLFLSYFLRTLVPKDHRKGIEKFRNEDYGNAITDFKNSYAFFKKYNWVDKYRMLALLSSSKITYKEMALNNIAFCHGQLGDGIKAKEYYELTLEEFPNSGIAIAGLNLLNSMQIDNSEESS